MINAIEFPREMMYEPESISYSHRYDKMIIRRGNIPRGKSWKKKKVPSSLKFGGKKYLLPRDVPAKKKTSEFMSCWLKSGLIHHPLSLGGVIFEIWLGPTENDE